LFPLADIVQRLRQNNATFVKCHTKVTARMHHLPDIVARSLRRYFKSS